MTVEQFLVQFPQYGDVDQEIIQESLNKASELVPRDLWGDKSLSCISIYAVTILKTRLAYVAKPIELPVKNEDNDGL